MLCRKSENRWRILSMHESPVVTAVIPKLPLHPCSGLAPWRVRNVEVSHPRQYVTWSFYGGRFDLGGDCWPKRPATQPKILAQRQTSHSRVFGTYAAT